VTVGTQRIVIKDNERVAYVGKTDSGKTYLARHILAPMPRLIVLDGKGSLGGKEWNLQPGGKNGSDVIRRMQRGEPGRLRFTAQTESDWLWPLDLAWSLGHVVVYIDEMLLVAPNGRPFKELTRLYQIGREMGIGVQAATQRPRNVPQVMFSEAEWLFLFRVSKKEDRKMVADFGDEDETMLNPIRDRHGFYTYNQTWRHPRYTPAFRAPAAQQRAGSAHLTLAKGA
jgi:hypothetical protein